MFNHGVTRGLHGVSRINIYLTVLLRVYSVNGEALDEVKLRGKIKNS
jgi:hypothetical protein